jgi:hypothetical protein
LTFDNCETKVSLVRLTDACLFQDSSDFCSDEWRPAGNGTPVEAKERNPIPRWVAGPEAEEMVRANRTGLVKHRARIVVRRTQTCWSPRSSG